MENKIFLLEKDMSFRYGSAPDGLDIWGKIEKGFEIKILKRTDNPFHVVYKAVILSPERMKGRIISAVSDDHFKHLREIE